MDLKNNIALVTGGASGLGRGTVEHFVSKGCKVAILDINDEKAKEVIDLLGTENVVYFKSPSDVRSISELYTKKIRIGGMVKKDSIEISNNKINFIITDFKNEINVIYSGAVPNLFSEEKGVVAEGYLKDRNFFLASKILAKHDENYMPPEVKAALKEK